MPDDDDPILVLLRRMDGKLDRLLADAADPEPQPAVLESFAEGGRHGWRRWPAIIRAARPGPARPDADQSLGMAGATSPDWPFASLQRVVDGQGRIEMALARLLPSGIGRAAGADPPRAFRASWCPPSLLCSRRRRACGPTWPI